MTDRGSLQEQTYLPGALPRVFHVSRKSINWCNDKNLFRHPRYTRARCGRRTPGAWYAKTNFASWRPEKPSVLLATCTLGVPLPGGGGPGWPFEGKMEPMEISVNSPPPIWKGGGDVWICGSNKIVTQAFMGPQAPVLPITSNSRRQLACGFGHLQCDWAADTIATMRFARVSDAPKPFSRYEPTLRKLAPRRGAG